MNSLMIDVETLGIRPSSVILSVGLVVFHETLPITDDLITLDLNWQLAFGRTVDADTQKWWATQSVEAQVSAFNTTSRSDARQLRNHIAVVMEHYDIKEVWAHSPSFDLVLLKDYFDSMPTKGAASPWDFRQERDTRTLFALAGGKLGDFGTTRTGTAHNALEDARFQAKEVIAARLKLLGAPPQAAGVVTNAASPEVTE